MHGVKSWFINKVYETFKPLWKYDVSDTCYAVGLWNNGFYVKELYEDEFPNIPRYCYRPQDTNPYNVYVYRKKDYTTVQKLYNAYMEGKLTFSSV